MTPTPPAERGAATVEFALVAVLLTLLLAALLQIGFAYHVRNVLVASAHEGARYGANADRAPEDGAARAREMIAAALSARFAGSVTGGVEESDGVSVVVVRVAAPLPLLGWLGPQDDLVVSGHAVREGP